MIGIQAVEMPLRHCLMKQLETFATSKTLPRWLQVVLWKMPAVVNFVDQMTALMIPIAAKPAENASSTIL